MTSFSEKLVSIPNEAHYRALIERLPLTMRPTPLQQLSAWGRLFPYEQNRLRMFLDGVAAIPPSRLNTLTQPLRALEVKMDLEHLGFTSANETMENSSLLARSEYYSEWRAQVQRIYGAIEAEADKAKLELKLKARSIVLILPASLPVDAHSFWKGWRETGQEIHLAQEPGSFGEAFLKGLREKRGEHADPDTSACWLIDAENKLGTHWGSPDSVSYLSYAALHDFRDRFLEAVNAVPKNIQASDQILSEVRHQNWEPWWPTSCGNDPRLRFFLIDLFLSGNGALIFPNSFVEWAASEALRRARPDTLVARFGLRARPKPFTGIAIFENQQRVSTLPDVDDSEGSSIDAQMLARYVWLAAKRYPEYEQSQCLCIAEAANSAWVITKPETTLPWNSAAAVSAKDLSAWISL